MLILTASPKDVPLGDVKLKQVGDWVGRRDKSPTAIARAFSRSWFHLYPNFGSLLSYVLWMGNDAFSLSGSSICFWLHDWVSNFSCWTWFNWTGKKGCHAIQDQHVLKFKLSKKVVKSEFERAYWRWNHKYQLPKYSGITPLLQVCCDCGPNSNLMKHYLIIENSSSRLAACSSSTWSTTTAFSTTETRSTTGRRSSASR